MKIEEMKAKKIELGLTTEEVASLSGIPLSTLQKIFGGVTKAPRRATIEAIERVLYNEEAKRRQRQQSRSLASYQNGSDYDAGMVREAPPAYGRAAEDKRRYNIDDYYALPDDQRVELIDGEFFEMNAPSLAHQMILGELYILFRECVKQHNMPCHVFLSPCDVRLDRDDYTIVQPDLIVFCHDFDINSVRYEGAPDLLVEILSFSTRSKDMILKLYKYQRAGVREYWIVDPRFKRVTVHYFEDEEYQPRIYDFYSEIPVAISIGKCMIDFSVIGKQMERQVNI